jgi:hypothetical protein
MQHDVKAGALLQESFLLGKPAETVHGVVVVVYDMQAYVVRNPQLQAAFACNASGRHVAYVYCSHAQ